MGESILFIPSVMLVAAAVVVLIRLLVGRNKVAIWLAAVVAAAAGLFGFVWTLGNLRGGFWGIPAGTDISPFLVKLTGELVIGWTWQIFSGIFGLLVFSVVFFLSLYAPEMFRDEEDPIPFYTLMLLLAGAIYLTLTAADLISLFFSWEVMSLVAFVMLLFYDRTKEGGPWLYAFWSGLSAMAMIAGIFMLEVVILKVLGKAIVLPFWGLGDVLAPLAPGQVAMTPIGRYPLLVVGGLLLLGIPFLVKASVPPFHTWAPRTYGGTHPAVAAFFSAAYSKVGIYAILVWLMALYKVSVDILGINSPVISLFSNVRNVPALFFILAVFVSVGGVIFSLLSLSQKDAMYLLAYSSMAQMGYMVLALILGIGYGAYAARDEIGLVLYMLGVWGAVYHAYAHGVFELSAYMALGAVYARSGETEFNELGAYGHRMPVTFWLGFIAMLSTVSIPLMWGFASKYMIYQAALYGRFFVLSALALIAGTASFLYAFRYLHGIFWGQPTRGYEYMHKIREVGVVGILVSIALMLITVVGGALPYRTLNFLTANLPDSMMKALGEKLHLSIPLVFWPWHVNVSQFGAVNFLFLITIFAVGMLVAMLVYVLSGGSKKVPLGDFYNSAEPPRPEWQLQLIGVFYGPIERVIEPYFRISIEAFYNLIGGLAQWLAGAVESFNTGDTRDYAWAMAVMLVILAIVWLV